MVVDILAVGDKGVCLCTQHCGLVQRKLGDFEGMVAWSTTKGMKGVWGMSGAVICEGIVGWDGGRAQFDFFLVLVSMMVERCFEERKSKKLLRACCWGGALKLLFALLITVAFT